MKVLTSDASPGIAALLDQRKRAGLDRFDEVLEASTT